MATSHPQPAPAGQAPVRAAVSAGTAIETAGTKALVPVPRSAEGDGELEFSAPVSRLPVELDVAIAVREFRVRDLLALAPGRVIESQWGHGSDMPLAAGKVQLAWTEFEVVETRLAVRVTRLA